MSARTGTDGARGHEQARTLRLGDHERGRGAGTADPADKGLLATMLELFHSSGAPATSAAIARAVGVPEEYADIIEQRLEHNRERGYVHRDQSGHWHATPSGIAAATSRDTEHAGGA